MQRRDGCRKKGGREKVTAPTSAIQSPLSQRNRTLIQGLGARASRHVLIEKIELLSNVHVRFIALSDCLGTAYRLVDDELNDI